MSSRVYRKPITVPAGVDVRVQEDQFTIKGSKGELVHTIPSQVKVEFADGKIEVAPIEGAVNGNALAGTTRALLNNNVEGVTNGYVIKLQLVGVGYRAQLGKGANNQASLNLTLGLSHPVSYVAPKGIELACPSVTDIEVKGINKQLVGQAAADIRGICKGIRKPEPYKGKGIRYADEKIKLKETKKK